MPRVTVEKVVIAKTLVVGYVQSRGARIECNTVIAHVYADRP